MPVDTYRVIKNQEILGRSALTGGTVNSMEIDVNHTEEV